MQVAIPVKLIFGVQNALRCTILITFHQMELNYFDSADIKYSSLLAREVVCRQAGKDYVSDSLNAAAPAC